MGPAMVRSTRALRTAKTERVTDQEFERSEPVPGVRLVTELMPHVRSVALGVWVDVGSRDEPPDLGGASHLLEHLLFKGTARRSALAIAQAFDAVGGEVNAYSAKEHTTFYARVLVDDTAMATDVLADMIGNALLDPDDLEAERKVVLEEIRMAADTPDDRVHDVFAEQAWPGHPLGRPVLGTEESIGSIERDRLFAYYRGGYVPGRLVVAAAGKVEHDSVASLVASAIGGGASAVAPREPQSPPPVVRRAHYEPKATEQVHVIWGCEAPSRRDPDRYAMSVLSTLLGAGMSSRLFQEVREKRGLVYSIYSYQHHYLETGLFAVYAGMSEAAAAQVLTIVRDQSALLCAGDARQEEVERAKGHVAGSLVLSMDDPGGRMSRLGKAELHDPVIEPIDEVLRKVREVTTEDVTRLARRLFSPGELVLACVGPMAEGSLDAFVEPL
jgi:predicted Zn-dependent peptidase